MIGKPLITQETHLIASVASIEDVIEAKAKDYGVDPELAKRIAFCESNMRQYNDQGEVLSGRQVNLDKGLFQINGYFHPREKIKAELGIDTFTVEGNTTYAMHLLKKPNGERHWNASRTCWETA